MIAANPESFGAARVATLDDLTELRRLEQLAAELAAPARGGELFLLHDARTTPLTDTIGATGTRVTIGTIDHQAVGYAVARIVELSDGDLLAVVSDLFVEPDAREVGVGEALMNDLLAWAEQEHCRGIDATALPGDRHTKNFFESFGLVARAISVHRSLRP